MTKGKKTQPATAEAIAQPSATPQPSATAAAAEATPPPKITKIELVISLLKHVNGASIEDLMDATGWQSHSVRGVIAGTLKKKLGLNVVSQKLERGRVYHIEPAQPAWPPQPAEASQAGEPV